jgi:hypothetical protein
MARDLTPRSRRWLQWASGLLLIVAGCAQSLAAIAAPQIPSGQVRIWFYTGYEPPGARGGTGSIPSIIAKWKLCRSGTAGDGVLS